jgi:hypothetical protein
MKIRSLPLTGVNSVGTASLSAAAPVQATAGDLDWQAVVGNGDFTVTGACPRRSGKRGKTRVSHAISGNPSGRGCSQGGEGPTNRRHPGFYYWWRDKARPQRESDSMRPPLWLWPEERRDERVPFTPDPLDYGRLALRW